MTPYTLTIKVDIDVTKQLNDTTIKTLIITIQKSSVEEDGYKWF